MASVISAGTTSGTSLNLSGDTSGVLQLASNGSTTAVTIDTSQNVGIGTSSPSSFAATTNLALGTGSSGAALTVFTGTAQTGAVYFADGTTSADRYRGAIEYSHSSNALLFTTDASERMRIDSSGNVGIGGTPQEILTVYGTTFNNGSNSIVSSFWSKNATIAEGSGYCQWNTSELAFKVGAYTGSPCIFVTNNAERMRITAGGEVYIAGTADQGAYNLQCNGTGVWGAGAYVNGSDERIKDDITPLDSGLDVVAKLNPVTYKYKEDWSKDQSIQTGFIAQELLTALEGKNYVDGVVQQGGQYMSVAYQNIIPILTKAIQELKAELDATKAEVQALKGVA